MFRTRSAGYPFTFSRPTTTKLPFSSTVKTHGQWDRDEFFASGAVDSRSAHDETSARSAASDISDVVEPIGFGTGDWFLERERRDWSFVSPSTCCTRTV